MRYDYWTGPDAEDRRKKYAKEFKPEYQAAGDELQRRFGAVISYICAQKGLTLPEGWASGWRPAAVNEATSNAGKLSQHLTANAGDKRDDVNGSLAWALFTDNHPLEVHALYMEHPVATVVRAWKKAKAEGREPTPWCHAQTVPPHSHSRVYFPDASSEKEWEEFLAMGGRPGMAYAEWLTLGTAPVAMPKTADPDITLPPPYDESA